MLAPDETVRLANVYSALRDKLLDLTKRNRMLSYSLGARSRRSLQIVDAIPNAVYRALVDQDASLALKALDEPKDIPADEKSEDFLEALDHARNTDIAYLTQISKSPWYPVIVSSTASIGDADQIASLIGGLNSSMERLCAELPRAAEFDLATVDDFKSVRSIGVLPDTISNANLLESVQLFDPNALEEHLRTKREILDLEAELSSVSEMQVVPIVVFEKAASIVRVCDPLPILNSPARDCLAGAREWLELLPTALEVFQSLSPTFEILKIPRDLEVSAIESVALCVIFSSDLKEEQRQWFARGISVDEASFAQFDAERHEIAKRDAEWRRQFISYRYSPWPSPVELREAAKLLRQGPFGKAFSAVVNRKVVQLTSGLNLTLGALV
jgi:hypothetical protein